MNRLNDVPELTHQTDDLLALVDRERHALAQIAAGVPIKQVLEDLLKAIEAQDSHKMLASVLILSDDRRRLLHGAGPSLPKAYNDAIDGIEVGEGVGSCGTAIARGAPVYVTDIEHDPLWDNFRALALEHDLHACWSTPVKATDGSLLGTFAIYYTEPRAPTPKDIESIAFITQTAALAIERHRFEERFRRDQDELRQLHETLSLATDAAEIGTWDLDLRTDTLTWSDRTKRMFGISPEVPCSMQNFYAGLHPDDLEETSAAFAAALDPTLRAPYDVEYRTIGKEDRQLRWIAAKGKGLFDDKGRCVRAIGTAIDITRRKENEQRLLSWNEELEKKVAERTAELNTLWETSPDLLVVIDFQGVFVKVNPAWTALLAYAPEELIGHHVSEFVLSEDARATTEAYELAAAGGLPKVVNRYRHKDGSTRSISWVAAPSGGVTYAIGRDVTAEREQADALAASQEALRQAQKMEAVGQLTGGLAHDFNNLLAIVSGSLDLMERHIHAGRLHQVERYLSGAQGATRRAAGLTHRLLAFSRRQTLDPKPTNINQLIAGMEELVRRTVGPAIEVQVVGAIGLWSALVDQNQLEGALLNLCINARDAMPDGGKLTIETANRWLDSRTALQRDLPSGQYISMCVSDTGCGMTPEVAAKAFDPFFTTKPLGQGTGLGLSMIYGFARQSGGQARIYSEVGEGTMVCIYLPRYHGNEVANQEVTPSVPARAEEGQTVLIVDDESGVRALVSEVLQDLGYGSLEAHDGPSAIKLLQSNARIDLLVTDVGLPGGMNGRQIADAARAIRPALKVLFITGYAENAAIGNGYLDPGMAVMNKPFALDALADRIREIIAEQT